MKNYVQKGDVVTFTAAADVSSGDGVLIGSLFGVACGDVANGAVGEMSTVGVFDLAKAPSQSWAAGVKVYWDSANARATSTATGNTLIGAALQAVAGGSGDVIGRVRLNGSAA